MSLAASGDTIAAIEASRDEEQVRAEGAQRREPARRRRRRFVVIETDQSLRERRLVLPYWVVGQLRAVAGRHFSQLLAALSITFRAAHLVS